ncbi:MAG: LamG domain-containing protein [Phycisphaerales bacterium]|nr:MAG: LamG domain-containing protein [Phycisphaerales bacterium]
MCSDIVVTDGSWDRIALVCDGEDRSLYVDDVLVAEDTQAGGPTDCSGGLNIGCGKARASETFFSGLIDDVRIYNRAVRP